MSPATRYIYGIKIRVQVFFCSIFILFICAADSVSAGHGPHTYKQSAASIVKLLPTWPGYQRPGFGAPSGVAPEGSGFFLAANLRAGDRTPYIVTAAHVIAAAQRIEIEMAGPVRVDAELLYLDEARDIAILKAPVKGTSIGIETLLAPDIGTHVCALGNPFGLGISLSCGVVSAVNRKAGFQPIEDFIQTDAAINPGMSGGALVDETGQLLGMINAIFTKEADIDAGVNFAISTALLAEVLSRPELPFCSAEKPSELLTNC